MKTTYLSLPKHFTSCLLILFVITSFAQSPVWQWSKNYGRIAYYTYIGQNTTTDASGNVILAGHYAGYNISFGTYTLNNTSLQPAYDSDAYLVKKDPSGNVLWAKSFGCSGNDAIYGVCTDAANNIFITGMYIGSGQSMVGMVLGTFTLNFMGGGGDLFLAKIDPNGNVLWVKAIGGTIGNEEGRSICTDPSGNVYLAGNSSSNNFYIGANTYTSKGATDFFIVKYSSSGSLLWSRQGGGTNFDLVNSIASDASGNTVLCGTFQSSVIVLGTQTLNNTTTSNTSDAFIIKYDASGNVLWTNTINGVSNEVIRSANIDSGGNIIVTGNYNSTVLSCGSSTFSNAGALDLFVAKYTTTGNFQWARTVGGSGTDDSYSLCTDQAGNIYIAGGFYSNTLAVANSTFNNINGSYDVLICKYNAAGNAQWAIAESGDSHEFANGICYDGAGNIYVSGYFISNTLTLGGNNLVNNIGLDNVFIARIFVGQPQSVGLHAPENPNKTLSIYPNPASQHCSLRLEQNEIFQLQIYDSCGRLVKQLSGNSGQETELTMDIGDLPAGIYSLHLDNKKGIGKTQLIINR